MTNSILIGETLFDKLSCSETLGKLVKSRIFPLVATNTTTFPFIVFFRDDIKTISNKDGYHEDDVNFTIVAVSNKYIESLEIANEIRNIFEKRKIVGKNLVMTDIQIDGVDEVWEENSYVQKLHFSCKIN